MDRAEKIHHSPLCIYIRNSCFKSPKIRFETDSIMKSGITSPEPLRLRVRICVVKYIFCNIFWRSVWAKKNSVTFERLLVSILIVQKMLTIFIFQIIQMTTTNFAVGFILLTPSQEAHQENRSEGRPKKQPHGYMKLVTTCDLGIHRGPTHFHNFSLEKQPRNQLYLSKSCFQSNIIPFYISIHRGHTRTE